MMTDELSLSNDLRFFNKNCYKLFFVSLERLGLKHEEIDPRAWLRYAYFPVDVITPKMIIIFKSSFASKFDLFNSLINRN